MSGASRDWSESLSACAPALIATLEAELRAAVRALPGVRTPLTTLRAFVGSKVESESAAASLNVPDLVLIGACLDGDAAALAKFDASYGEDMDRAAGKGASAGVRPEELRAAMMHELFVEPRKAAQFSGRSELRRWVRVVASRWVVDRIRRAAVRPEQRPTEPAALADAVQTRDPELRYLGERYREPVRVSLERAFGRLTPRERNLLRLRLLERWGHDKLGARYGVHRTSAARWVSEAQRSLLEHARACMRDDFGISKTEFDTIARAVQSQLHVSLERVLDVALETED